MTQRFTILELIKQIETMRFERANGETLDKEPVEWLLAKQLLIRILAGKCADEILEIVADVLSQKGATFARGLDRAILLLAGEVVRDLRNRFLDELQRSKS